MPVVETEGVIGGKPRPEGRRISLIRIAELVFDYGEGPAAVADQLAISLAEVLEALAYYYDHREQFESEERVYASTRRAGEQRIQE